MSVPNDLPDAGQHGDGGWLATPQITERRPRSDQASLAERAFFAVLRGEGFAVILVGPELDVEWANSAAMVLTGFQADELLGRAIVDLLHPDDVEDIAAGLLELLCDAGRATDLASTFNVDVRLATSAASFQWVELVAHACSADPDVNGIVIVLRDARAKHALESLATSAPLDKTLLGALDAVHSLGCDIRAVVAHAEAPDGRTTWLGSDLVDRASATRALLAARHSNELQLRVDDQRGRAMWAHPILADGNCTGVLVIEVSRAAGPTPSMLRDLARITHVMSAAVSWHRRDAEATLARTHDRLTGLANRAAFFAALDYRAVSLHDHVIALFYVDLDDFEQKRTQWGETIGDGVLVEIGDRLRRVSRGSDLVARVGPHDFTLLCADLPSEDVVVSISERLVELLSQPFTVCGEVLRVPASVGVSTTQGHLESAALFAISTHASYRARVGDAG